MADSSKNSIRTRKPVWLRTRLPSDPTYQKVRSLLHDGVLHTVCQEARCPNQWECFSRKTATFLILGDRCTRRCRFCAVQHGPETPPDPTEPERVAAAAARLGLRYLVVTSVTRDDLADGGAGAFAEIIRAIRGKIPQARVEVLIPDFQGSREALQTVLEAGPDVLNHNVETAARLYDKVRPGARYDRSLELLRRSRQMAPTIVTKSGMMLGLGETDREIEETLRDLVRAGCRMLTLGQYLQPSAEHLPVARFLTPEEFEQWRVKALKMGFSEVASSPLVRSSYHAADLFQSCRQKDETDGVGH